MAWQISGDYFEAYSCDYVCPCVTSNLNARPTQGWCTFAFAQHIERGSYDDVQLDGLNFVIIGRTPEEMGKGNWTVGLITDERASTEQQQAIVAIASGQAGGPIAILAGLIGNSAGGQGRPIRFEKDGLRYAASTPEMPDQALEGMVGGNGTDAIFFDN